MVIEMNRVFAQWIES